MRTNHKSLLINGLRATKHIYLTYDKIALEDIRVIF